MLIGKAVHTGDTWSFWMMIVDCILLRVYCHRCMMHSQISDRYGGVDANVLNNRLRTADRGWSSRPWFCDLLTSVHRRIPAGCKMLYRVSETERLLWTTMATGMDIRCGMRIGRSLFMPCLLRTVTWELAKFILNLVEYKRSDQKPGNIEPPGDFMLSLEKGTRMVSRVTSHVGFHKSN
jgi:hypothetical protein